ncbi:MAG TPA: DUF1549 domain-containing protein, partial [Armatimonadota bacterium]|nr:DUF1549 domain-containing protein [Armatimonadota bacterium]
MREPRNLPLALGLTGLLLAPAWWAGSAGVAAAPAPAKPAALPASSAAQGTEFFESRIRPLLAQKCYACHSAQSKSIGGGLLLDSRAGVLKGGAAGPSVVAGKPEASPLIQAVRQSGAVKMPPGGKLTAQEIADLEAWVRMGAPDPREGAAPVKAGYDWEKERQFWSFQPLRAVPPPAVKNKAWAKTPIDRFLLAKLEAKKLKPVPDADRRTLLRRVTFDLTGLPPTPEEVQAFLTDKSPDAYRKVVERLLASPAYGEKWGRHWLDLVRYADTSGCNSDFPIPNAYRYRNYVINAFNQDKPYDEFLKEQLAGDLLPAKSDAERYEHIIATGYLAISRRFGSQANEFYLTIEDTIDNVGKTMLGLSVNCARCHDHKFD